MAKRVKKTSRYYFPHVLIVLGLILVSIWGLHRYFYNQSLRLSDAILATYTKEESIPNLPAFIDISGIPRLHVVEAIKTNKSWPVSPDKANHVYLSAQPGQPGNIIIYGHNTDRVFGNIRRLKIGDPITIITINGKRHAYQVESLHTVPTTQTSLLAPTTFEVLTLYTCTGFLDSQRLVARAIPVK